MPVATKTFTAPGDGQVVKGEHVADNHELVRRYPRYFAPDTYQQRIDQATVRGARRDTRRQLPAAGGRTRMDVEDMSTLAQMIALGTTYIDEQDELGNESNVLAMKALLLTLTALLQAEVNEDEGAEPEDETLSADGRSAGRGTRSPAAHAPTLRTVPRYTVELTRGAYMAIDNADGLGDGRETGGALFGNVNAGRIVIGDASGPGEDALRQYARLRVDWEYLRRVERAQAHTGRAQLGHWHSHPGTDATPSAADLLMWADSLRFIDGDVYVGLVVSEPPPGAVRMRLDAWTVSRRDGETVCERANLSIPERIW
jgi:integrative and conjugative element protein (TIGR02256 family)